MAQHSSVFDESLGQMKSKHQSGSLNTGVNGGGTVGLILHNFIASNVAWNKQCLIIYDSPMQIVLTCTDYK